jgi:epoxide hydrolase-like predicted phosphatase
MIKAIIFDCFGVLTQDGWKAFVEDLPDEDAKETARKLNHQYDAGLISLEKFLAGVKKATGRDYDIINSARSSEGTKNIQLIGYIRELKKKYKIGILSNVATNWVRDYLLAKDEQALFEAMVFSFEAGTTKPDPKIYLTILEKLDVKPEEAVFTDDARHYCEAASQLGMRAIWYEDFESFREQLEKILAASADN